MQEREREEEKEKKTARRTYEKNSLSSTDFIRHTAAGECSIAIIRYLFSFRTSEIAYSKSLCFSLFLITMNLLRFSFPTYHIDN